MPGLRQRLGSLAAAIVVAILVCAAPTRADVISANDIARMIQNSTTTSSFMKQNAGLFAAIAVGQESTARGQPGYSDSTIFNGSCCYGIFQLNAAASAPNVQTYSAQAGYGRLSGSAYAALSPAEQIDIYGKYEAATEAAVKSIMQLAASGNGPTLSADDEGITSPVDAAFIVACMQMGPGYCKDAINANSCNDAYDGNSQSICKFARNARANLKYCTDASVCSTQGVSQAAVNEVGSTTGTGGNTAGGASTPSGLSGITGGSTGSTGTSGSGTSASGTSGSGSTWSPGQSFEMPRLEGKNF